MPSRVAWSLVLISIVISSGCGHVGLRAPASSAPDLERIAAYERLRPAAQVNEILYKAENGQVIQLRRSLLLADGTTVRYAEDLLPVVADDSVSAQATRR